jgi:hypothetical protein
MVHALITPISSPNDHGREVGRVATRNAREKNQGDDADAKREPRGLEPDRHAGNNEEGSGTR